MNKYLTELIGTFFLVFTIGCVVLSPTPVAVPPLAIGAVLMVMIYAGGHVSGAHYNPAVTLGVWIRGKLPAADVGPYMASQVAGSVLATLAVKMIMPSDRIVIFVPRPGPALLAEFLFTFALVYVVLNVATSKDNTGNSFYGLAIGFTVLSGAFAVGGISAGAFNPAVAVGISAMGIVPWSSLWIYLVADFLGGVVAAWTFRTLNLTDR